MGLAGLWQTLKDLALHPAEGLAQRLLAHRFIPSLALGLLSYYGSVLPVSEILLPPALGGAALWLVNVPVSLGRMVLTVWLIHLACQLVTRTGARWGNLLTIWGYTQLPWIVLTALAGVWLATVSPTAGPAGGLVGVFGLAAIAVGLLWWGLRLKLQAVQICYGLQGTRLVGVIALALLLNGALLWTQRRFVTERAVVAHHAFEAMHLPADLALAGRRPVPLPFDTLTYHLRSPQRGEIVGVLPPGGEHFLAVGSGFRLRHLGRIVGLPEETVEVRNGRVFLEDRELSEPYVTGSPGIHLPPLRLPPGAFLILGDNRSRLPTDEGGGVVPQSRIRGRLTALGRLKWRFLVGQWPW